MPQPVASPDRSNCVVEDVVPLDRPQHAGGPDVPPVLGVSCRSRRSPAPGSAPGCRPARRGPRRSPDRRSRPDARGRGSTRVLALNRHPAHLDVAEEHHPGRPPVLERVREHVRIHERAPRLPGAERAELAVGMAKPKRRLALVHAGAEQLELEGGLQVADRRSGSTSARRGGFAARPRTCCGLRPNSSSNGRQPGDAQRVEPVRVDLLEVVADVEHRKPVDLEARLGLRAARRSTLGA